MPAHRRYRFDDFTLDLRRGALYRGPNEVKLRPKSFAVLQALVERSGELVSKDELLERVWGRTVVTDGAITQCLIDIRRALGDDAQEIVRTQPRRGYIFTLPVASADDEQMGVAGPAPAMPALVDVETDVAVTPVGAGIGSTADLDPDPAAVSAAQGDPVQVPRPRRSIKPAWLAVTMLAAVGTLGWWWSAGHSARPAKAAAASATATTERAGEQRRSIAVLPFVNLTGQPDGEYVSDGIAEEILHLLTQGEGLRVIARTSSFAFKGQATSIQDIAAKLGVDYVVEGSVRRAGNSLRVNVQLVDASSSSQLWSKAYDRDVRDLLAVQEDIAQHIATELQSSLVSPADATGHTPEPAAYDAYLRARYFYFRRYAGDMALAEKAYLEALRLDPQLARAWAGLAGVYGVLLGEAGTDKEALLSKQKAALDAALAADPKLAEAHIRAAAYYVQVGDRARVTQAVQRAQELAPEDPMVMWWSANELTLEGRLDEAIAIERRILGMDPASRMTRVNLAITLLAAGRLDEARKEFMHFQEMGAEPDPDVTFDLARIDMLQGRAAQAFAAAEQWPDSENRDFVLAAAGAGLNRGDVARAAESRLVEGASVGDAVRLAELHAHRAHADDAFHWVDIAYERLGPNPFLSDDWQWLYQMKLSPFLRTLRTDARWPAMQRRGLGPADQIDVAK